MVPVDWFNRRNLQFDLYRQPIPCVVPESKVDRQGLRLLVVVIVLLFHSSLCVSSQSPHHFDAGICHFGPATAVAEELCSE